MDANTLRKKFIEFFVKKQHKEIVSSSLIPENDPTVLFTTAGMQPLVPFLLGEKHPLGKRLVGVQKCIRTGDIDSVGDNSHLTFFEMLGNWSLGDYFKKESIQMSFEFLTDVLKIPVDKLAITCFKDKNKKDLETYNAWLKLGIPEKRIAFLEDNWWGPAGETGPCGPDTEIFYWTGKEDAPETFDPDDDRWLEIWNNVFMEYYQDKNKNLNELKQKNVDTGMGLERVAKILEKKESIYEISLFKPIYDFVKSISTNYNTESIRIITDHMKAVTFILGDDKRVFPSNVDQGYILRRLIRRVIRHLRLIGVDIYDQIITPKIANIIINIYYSTYPELLKNKSFIFEQLEKEENKFKATLEKGIAKFNRMIKTKTELSGEEAFLLFQSYGFPIEITQELAKEKGIHVDVNGFDVAFKKHQELSRLSSEKKFKSGLADNSEQTTKLHTATHLLNEALRRVLSKDIRQKGSNITPERLRFDFNFHRKLTPEEIKQVEDLVNEQIQLGLPIKKEKMKLTDALKSGAQAEFGSKYPDEVWVYSIGDFSKEICSGPHVNNTKELGHFKIIKEKSSASGIRRIKAILE